MTPIVFDGCFGWLHPGSTSRAVVLCGPVGREADSTYRAWRDLAEHLASRGVSALRFDYPGLGNSRDLEPGEDALGSWIASVDKAMRWLKTRDGIEDVGFVGIRLGAALALRCAEETGGVAQLVLLAPVASGASYQKERAILDRLSRQAEPAPDPPPVRRAGAVFTAEATMDLRPLRYALERAPAPEVLMVVEAASRAATPLSDQLESLGATLHTIPFEGYGALMVDPELSIYPAAVFDEVVDWLAERPKKSTGEAPMARAAAARLDLPEATETGILFDADTPLFGVLCEPHRRQADGAGVLFLNTAGAAHSGMNRIWVSMARRLATLGVESLRFDIAGVGDSSDPPGRPSAPLRVEDAFVDVIAAARWLKARGCRTVTLVGFCWGAQLAYNVAIDTDEVEGLVMINSARQFWDLDDSAKTAKVFGTYVRLTWDPEKWRSVLKGEFAPSEMWRFAREMIEKAVNAGLDRLRGVEHPSLDAARKLRALRSRGVRALMIQGEDDPFLAEIEDYFATPRARLGALLDVETRYVANLDHLLRSEKNIADLVDIVSEHFRRMGANSPAPRVVAEKHHISEANQA